MTTGAGIATCSAVLQQLFADSLVAANLGGALGTAPTVSVLPPDRITVGATERPQLNLFVYSVTPNVGWANRELPSHDASGTRVAATPLALDLHYVVSAYGLGDMHADVLLGHAAMVVHTTRYLTRERVRDLAGASGIAVPLRALLAASGLDAQEEMIRLTPEHLSIDDISKLWSVLGEKYRTSMAFTASVIVLRPAVDSVVAAPVTLANLRVLPLPIAQITHVDPDPVSVGDTVVLEGSGLRSESSVVRFGGQSDVQVPPGATDRRVEVAVPADVLAGHSAVQVIHSVDFGPQSSAREAADSNVMRLTIRPRFALQGGLPDIDVSTVTSTAGTVDGGTIDVTLEPEVGRDQRVRILLTGINALAGRQFVLGAPSRALDAAPSVATISVDATGLPTGDYLIRVEVDGVATLLEQTVNPDGSRTPFDAPQVTLP